VARPADYEVSFYVEGGEPITASAEPIVHVPKGVAHALQVDSQASYSTRALSQHEEF
jgi:quercetin dioxygenase-like cupin family protein